VASFYGERPSTMTKTPPKSGSSVSSISSGSTTPLYTDIIKKTRVRQVVDYAEEEDEEKDVKEEDEEKDVKEEDEEKDVKEEDEDDQTFLLAIRKDTRILVIGDDARYDSFVEEGFTNVMFRTDSSKMGSEPFDIMFYKE